MTEARTTAPQGADRFRADTPGQSTRAVSPEADDIARILEGPANPRNPRYDNLTLGPVHNLVIRAVRDYPLELDEFEFEDGLKAARDYLNAAKTEKDAKKDKENLAAFLAGIARRVPGFRGIGFIDENSSATIVEVKSKSIPEENVPEVVRQAGPELETFATQQIQLTVDVPHGLTDRKGNEVSTDELQRRMAISIGKILGSEDKVLYRFARLLKVNDWKKLAGLVRNGTVSHDLIKAEEDYVVRPIALSQIPKEKIKAERQDIPVQEE